VLGVSSTLGVNQTAVAAEHTWSPRDPINHTAPLCELPTNTSGDPTCSTAGDDNLLSQVELVIILDHCVAEVFAYEGLQKGGPVVTSGLHVTQNGNATRLFVPPDSGGAVTVTMQAWRLSLKTDDE